MFGIILASIATLIGEVGKTIGKNEVAKRRESILGMGFLNSLWGTFFFFSIAFLIPRESAFGSLFDDFYFSTELIPVTLFVTRACLEIILINLVIRAASIATRSTFAFLRMLIIPLLLLVDIYLGYDISILEITGITVILTTTLILVSSNTLKRAGMWHIIGSSLIGVCTVSMYKYNITNYNSVVGEQLPMTFFLLSYLFIATYYTTKRNPLRHFKRPQVILQSFTIGIESVITSFAFSLAPSSIVMTARRTSSVLWSIMSGNLYFKEKKARAKLAGLSVLGFGLYLLTNPF